MYIYIYTHIYTYKTAVRTARNRGNDAPDSSKDCTVVAYDYDSN